VVATKIPETSKTGKPTNRPTIVETIAEEIATIVVTVARETIGEDAEAVAGVVGLPTRRHSIDWRTAATTTIEEKGTTIEAIVAGETTIVGMDGGVVEVEEEEEEMIGVMVTVSEAEEIEMIVPQEIEDRETNTKIREVTTKTLCP